jgi:hypothetical protein
VATGSGKARRITRTALLGLVRSKPDSPISFTGLLSRKQAWIKWLSKYVRAGAFAQSDRRRDAGFIYNNVKNVEMILWLADASDVDPSLVRKASRQVPRDENRGTQAAAMRQLIPWKIVALKFRHSKTSISIRSG